MNAQGEMRRLQSTRPALLAALRATSALFAVLVLVQAILAGRGWFVDFDLIRVHGYIGNAVFLLAVVQVALVYAAGLRNVTLVVSSAILLLVFAQVGLGYAGRESAVAASLHVPNGVLLFGLTTAVCLQVFGLGRDTG